MGNGTGTLRFNGVSAAAAGDVAVTIAYASGSERSAQLSVNGDAPTSVTFASTGGFGVVGTKDVTVTLQWRWR